MILSAILIEVSRWAMTTVVLSDLSRAMFAEISASRNGSRFASGSSRISSSGSRRKARAIPRR